MGRPTIGSDQPLHVLVQRGAQLIRAADHERPLQAGQHARHAVEPLGVRP
jgi:hypothetical protein